MAAQDVADIVPRVRRALEGVRALPEADPSRLSDEQVEAAAADAIGDLILYTGGLWAHTLAITGTDPQTGVSTYSVDPELSLPEQGLVAAQVALNQFVFGLSAMKTSERIKSEGREHEWSISAQALRDALKLLIAQRDHALKSAIVVAPPLARAASYLAHRDPLAAALIEPYVDGVAGRGGIVLTP